MASTAIFMVNSLLLSRGWTFLYRSRSEGRHDGAARVHGTGGMPPPEVVSHDRGSAAYLVETWISFSWVQPFLITSGILCFEILELQEGGVATVLPTGTNRSVQVASANRTQAATSFSANALHREGEKDLLSNDLVQVKSLAADKVHLHILVQQLYFRPPLLGRRNSLEVYMETAFEVPMIRLQAPIAFHEKSARHPAVQDVFVSRFPDLEVDLKGAVKGQGPPIFGVAMPPVRLIDL
jgi:hypothetical protein